MFFSKTLLSREFVSSHIVNVHVHFSRHYLPDVPSPDRSRRHESSVRADYKVGKHVKITLCLENKFTNCKNTKTYAHIISIKYYTWVLSSFSGRNLPAGSRVKLRHQRNRIVVITFISTDNSTIFLRL